MERCRLMEKYAVKKIENVKDIKVTVPGSKSITARALLLAAMGNGRCVIDKAAFCDDSRAFMDCLDVLGFKISADDKKRQIEIIGCGGNIPNKKANLNVKSSGTTARFLTAFLAVVGGEYYLDASPQMKKRPMDELLDLLKKNGVKITYPEEKGHFPFFLNSPGIKDINASIDTTKSSQYASALLMCGTVSGAKITLLGSRTKGSYIEMTARMMNDFGIGYERNGNVFEVSRGQYHIDDYTVEPDVSAACYFYAMAPLLGTRSKVFGVHQDSIQGDIKFLDILRDLGCVIEDGADGIMVDAFGLKQYPGVIVDMSDFSDQSLTMAVLAAFASTSTTIKNIGHIRGQESDRVMAMVNELQKIGCDAKIQNKDKMTDVCIVPGPLHGARIDTYNDHRVAMSFALAGLRIDGIVINNPGCCTKTFENYFDILDDITGNTSKIS